LDLEETKYAGFFLFQLAESARTKELT